MCKSFSIIPIFKMRKILASSISLTSCVSKLFELIILFCELFFLGSNSILFLSARSVPSWSVSLYLNFYRFQSIMNGFNKPNPGSRMTLASNDFLRLSTPSGNTIYKPILVGLPPCFARWTLSFLSDRHSLST